MTILVVRDFTVVAFMLVLHYIMVLPMLPFRRCESKSVSVHICLCYSSCVSVTPLLTWGLIHQNDDTDEILNEAA